MDHLQQQLTILVQAAREARIPAKLFERICIRQFVLETLEANNLNVCKSAIEMGMHRNTLTRKIDDLDINLCSMRKAKQFLKKSVASERPYTLHSTLAR